MPLDHYVSQVHLKNFYSPALANRMMYAIKKSNLKSFQCRSQDVCRIENGSTNAYLQNDRAIEEFLCVIEPKYNASIAKLRDKNIDDECIFTIAGFVAFVGCCAPTGMRLQTPPLQGMLEDAAIILDRHGRLPKSPESVDSKSFTELLAEGAIGFKVDQKFPQAFGIDSIIEYVAVFGNSTWEILRNTTSDSSFFTSDFPTTIEDVGPLRPSNKVIPLAPDLAIRILPDPQWVRTTPDLSFTHFRYTYPKLARAGVVEINRLIVRCAEDMIFYRDNYKWISDFVAKNRHYLLEAVRKLRSNKSIS